MEEPNSDLQHSPSKIHGAVSAGDMETDQNYDPQDLPMIVWLRGDESYVGEFTLSADESMNALGIKRSRLTQISGKELRVGRIRMDRYIRPVYRQTDIDAYLEWTRPTATHIKSSDVLLQAATELRGGTREIADQITAHLNQVQDRLVQSHDAVASETYRIQREATRLLNERLDIERQELAERLTGFGTQIGDHFQTVEQRLHKLEQQVGEVLEETQSKLADLNGQVLAAMSESQAATLRAVEANGETLRDLSSAMETTRRGTEESYELAFESFGSIRETMDQQARFHRGVAEALAKIIEVQRELLQLRNASVSKEQSAKVAVRPKDGLRHRRQIANVRGMNLRRRAMIRS